jgi:ArpU family phage transcriptional regulator
MESWRSTYKKETKRLIKEAFNKYKCSLLTIKEYEEIGEYDQSTTANYESEPVNGTRSKKNFENNVDKVRDAEIYRDKFDKVLVKLPGLYKSIMIDCYIRKKRDILIWIDLGLPERTYYYMKSEAIMMFYDEMIAQEIKI